jgi:hypothetical protein
VAYDPALLEAFANKFGVSTVDGTPAGGGSPSFGPLASGYVPAPAGPPAEDPGAQVDPSWFQNGPQLANAGGVYAGGALGSGEPNPNPPPSPYSGKALGSGSYQAPQQPKPDTSTEPAPPGAGVAVPQQALTIAPQFIPAGWDPRRMPYRQGSLEDQAQAMAGVTVGQQHTADVQAAGQSAAAEELQQYASRLRDQNRDDMLAEQERQRRYTDIRNRASQLADEAADLKVQPGRIFQDAGPASAIVMAIGGALGGFLSARTGGPNQFLQTVDKLIERDMHAQQVDIDQKWRKADAARNSLMDLRSQLGDERLADEVQRARVDKWMSTKIGAIATQSNSDVIKARAQELQDALAMRLADRQLELDKLAWRPAQLVGGSPAVKQEDQELMVRTPDGQFIRARSAAEAQKLRADVPLAEDIKAGIAEALQIREQPRWWMDPKALQRLNQIATVVEPKISQFGDKSVLRDAERENMRETVTAFSSYRPGTSDNLRKVSADFDKTIGRRFAQQAAPYVQEGFTHDAHGRLVPSASYTGKQQLPKPTVMPGSFKPAVGNK